MDSDSILFSGQIFILGFALRSTTHAAGTGTGPGKVLVFAELVGGVGTASNSFFRQSVYHVVES